MQLHDTSSPKWVAKLWWRPSSNESSGSQLSTNEGAGHSVSLEIQFGRVSICGDHPGLRAACNKLSLGVTITVQWPLVGGLGHTQRRHLKIFWLKIRKYLMGVR